MGIDTTFGSAYLKSQIADGQRLLKNGSVFIIVKNQGKRDIVFIFKKLADFGFALMATSGTADVLMRMDYKEDTLPPAHLLIDYTQPDS